MRVLLALLLLSTLAPAQQALPSEVNAPQSVTGSPSPVEPKSALVGAPTAHPTLASSPNADAYTLPAGTRIPVTLKISTKTARENDPVYAETSFPVVSKGHIVLPVGTYVHDTGARCAH